MFQRGLHEHQRYADEYLMLYQKKSTCFASTVLFTVTMTATIKQGQCQDGKGGKEKRGKAEERSELRGRAGDKNKSLIANNVVPIFPVRI